SDVSQRRQIEGERLSATSSGAHDRAALLPSFKSVDNALHRADLKAGKPETRGAPPEESGDCRLSLAVSRWLVDVRQGRRHIQVAPWIAAASPEEAEIGYQCRCLKPAVWPRVFRKELA